MNVVLLGATGSVGSQVLDVIKENNINLIGVSLGSDIERSKKIVLDFKPKFISLRKKEDIKYFSFYDGKIFYGDNGLENLSSIKCDMIINALSGSSGLIPTIKAIEANNDIALANKESLVMAGDIIMKLARDKNVNIYPVDSEHSAIWQIIKNEDHSKIKRIIITASGGAFRDKKREELIDVTIEDALKHPNWSMGKKITVDCATMMNKGFEVIEAHHLFDIPYKKIETILHKESIIHSLVEFNDSQVKAIMANPDMRMPIEYALSKGNRFNYSNDFKFVDMHFQELSFDRYPCLKYAYDAGIEGGIMPTILCSSNEAAVELFLDGKIKFLDIERIVYDEFRRCSNFTPTIEDIIRVNREVKERILGGK